MSRCRRDPAPGRAELAGTPLSQARPRFPLLFNSFAFAVFFVCVFSAYWVVRRRENTRVLLLLGSSYFFYGWWSWKFLGLIVFSTVLDYFVGLRLARTTSPRGRRFLITLSLTGNLGVLAFFKYFGFFTKEAVRMLGWLGLDAHPVTLEILLPVGISFYTFQTLSYTLDIYRGSLEPERNPLRFALFVAFFPQLVAGPIVRASHFLPQIPKRPVLTRAAFDAGLALIFWGLFKKVVIADYLGRELVDPFWDNPAMYGGLSSLVGVWGYALQIYGDFSGYSDIAIGAAMLLGFDLGLNFDTPYRALSFRDFWRRWHISLSTWLRDYLYIPLGGNRGGPHRVYANLMITMLLGGLWHGASWMFVLWGAFHGALLAIDRMLDLQHPTSFLGKLGRRVLVFHLVCVGWIFFRSQTPADAWAVFASFANLELGAGLAPGVLIVVAVGFATHFWGESGEGRVRRSFTALPSFARGAVYALLLGLIMSVHSLDAPFIYFQF